MFTDDRFDDLKIFTNKLMKHYKERGNVGKMISDNYDKYKMSVNKAIGGATFQELNKIIKIIRKDFNNELNNADINEILKGNFKFGKIYQQSISNKEAKQEIQKIEKEIEKIEPSKKEIKKIEKEIKEDVKEIKKKVEDKVERLSIRKRESLVVPRSQENKLKLSELEEQKKGIEDELLRVNSLIKKLNDDEQKALNENDFSKVARIDKKREALMDNRTNLNQELANVKSNINIKKMERLPLKEEASWLRQERQDNQELTNKQQQQIRKEEIKKEEATEAEIKVRQLKREIEKQQQKVIQLKNQMIMLKQEGKNAKAIENQWIDNEEELKKLKYKLNYAEVILEDELRKK